MFDVRSDLVKVGTDPDFGSDIIDKVYYVEYQTDYGEAFRYTGEQVDKAHCERLAEIFTHQADRGDLDPRDHDEWQWDRYVYGSQAYLNNYSEAEAARMDSEERAHFGY